MKEKEFFKLLDDISEDILTETDKYRKSGVSNVTGNSSDIIVSDSENEINGEVVHQKRKSFKRITAALTALTAAAAGIVISVSHFDGKPEKNTLSEEKDKVTSSDYLNEESSDSQYSETEKSEVPAEYRAEVIDSVFSTLPAGNFDGNCIFLKGEEEKNAVIRNLSGSFDDRKIYNENGQKFEIISGAVQYDNNILISGATDAENNYSREICVYGNTFDEVLYSVYPEANETLSFSAFSEDTVFYISQTEKFCLNAVNVKTSEKKQIVFDTDSIDYDYVSHPGILKSGNICVLGKKYTSDICYTDLIIFDRELNLVKTENIKSGSSILMNQVAGYADGNITVYSEEADGSDMNIKVKVLYCDEEDNFTAGEETDFNFIFNRAESISYFMYPLTNGKYSLIYGTENSIFGFDPLTGESDNLSEYLTDGSYLNENCDSFFFFFLDNELCMALSKTEYIKRICTDPYGNNTICSVGFGNNLQNSYKMYCNNGKLYLFVPESLITDYMSSIDENTMLSPRKRVVYEINLSTGEYTESEMVSETEFSSQLFYADENYYILSAYVSGKTNSEYKNGSICILNHDGKMLKNISPPEDDYTFMDIFKTANNELILTGCGKNGNSAYTLNTEDGILQLRDDESPYIHSTAHITGDGSFSFYYLNDESIYGVKETADGTVNEKIAELSGMNEQSAEGYMGSPRFAWSENEQVWYVFSGGRLFKSVRK